MNSMPCQTCQKKKRKPFWKEENKKQAGGHPGLCARVGGERIERCGEKALITQDGGRGHGTMKFSHLKE